MIKVSVLGPLRLDGAGGSFAPTASKPKKVLALLAFRANRPVFAAELIDEIWNQHPPATALGTLQTYIRQLRRLIEKALGPGATVGAHQVLGTLAGGYQLNLPPGHLDLEVFHTRAREGRQVLDDGDDQAGSELLGSALRLWRGPALFDVEHGPLLSLHMSRLEQCHLGVTEQRIEADLRLGRHQEVLGDLAVLTKVHPFNENLRALQMVALYRAGRRRSALQVFHELRQVLVDELGLEPPLRLHRLQHAILSSAPELELPAQSVHPLDRLLTS
ncbi:AfsR/SARP family transcriptional regulator [Actinokineospora enzanensis]|uniref:AfsR/SARP family transcriptional regulator n=1 Tax=Actinokineospora enzanensis TaxID=155975 RepID=UPI000370E361|nr:AfsR/SARP family transcriptional regulator [Actinokineospora enzanensis]